MATGHFINQQENKELFQWISATRAYPLIGEPLPRHRKLPLSGLRVAWRHCVRIRAAPLVGVVICAGRRSVARSVAAANVDDKRRHAM